MQKAAVAGIFHLFLCLGLVSQEAKVVVKAHAFLLTCCHIYSSVKQQ